VEATASWTASVISSSVAIVITSSSSSLYCSLNLVSGAREKSASARVWIERYVMSSISTLKRRVSSP